MRQLIIVRKDLQMSAGKLAAQCCHASMAFLTNDIKKGERAASSDSPDSYNVCFPIKKAVYDDWICGIFTKTICEAKSRKHLLKAIDMAQALGLVENTDYYLISDNCLTELEPEEVDENGIGRTLTCIGFRPMCDEIIQQISRRYQLYRGHDSSANHAIAGGE